MRCGHLCDEVICNKDNIPLDENAGEGIHRGVTYSKLRSPSTARIRILAGQRHKQNIGLWKTFLKTHGQSGIDALQYVWDSYKSLVRSPRGVLARRRQGPRLKSCKLKPKEFYR